MSKTDHFPTVRLLQWQRPIQSSNNLKNLELGCQKWKMQLNVHYGIVTMPYYPVRFEFQHKRQELKQIQTIEHLFRTFYPVDD